MRLDYKTRGTCSRMIHLEIEDGIIKSLSFEGGCNGNLKGIASLAVGRKAIEVADIIRGTDCGGKGTSCPDQLAHAIDKALSE